MLPLAALGLGSAGAGLFGSLLDQTPNIDWGALMARYLGQLGPAYRQQFMANYGALSPLTMGQENAPGYADAALSAFQHSGAYQGLLSNLANQANSNAQAGQGNAGAYGQNFGVGQATFNLANPGAMMNQYVNQALIQQYLQGQQQFGQLAGLRLGSAGEMTRGAAGLTGQAAGQYQQQPSFGQRLGQGLQGLGNAGFNYLQMQGLAGLGRGLGGQAMQGGQGMQGGQFGQPAPGWSPYQAPTWRPQMP